MRLLIYIHSLENGGAERVVANLANHWAGLGWEVTVVTVAPLASDFYQVHPRVGRVALNLTGHGGNLVTGFWRTARRVHALRRVLTRLRPDVALSAMHTANVVLSMAARGIPGLVALGSEHNFPPKAPMGIVWETLRRHAYGHLAAVAALTSECAAWLGEHSHARRVPVIPNPVCWPLANAEPVRDPLLACRPGRRILLAVGRMSEEKNFTTLVALFARLAPRHPGWDLVVLGDGPLRAALQAQAQEAGLAERIRFPGRVGNVGDWYARASLYAMSSHFEGFPNTLVEAMTYGLPAVSFDCDTGPRDIIRHGVDGFLVGPGNDAAMEAALDTLMRDAILRARFATRAIEARERFSIEKISRMWESLFLPDSLEGASAPGQAGARKGRAPEPT